MKRSFSHIWEKIFRNLITQQEGGIWKAIRPEGLQGDKGKIDMSFHCDMVERNKCSAGLYIKRQTRK